MAITTCVDYALEDLSRLLYHRQLPSSMKVQVKKLQLELSFFKMFFRCFRRWEDAAKDSELLSAVNQIGDAIRKAGRGLLLTGEFAISYGETKNWEIVTSKLQGKLENFKPAIKDVCLVLLDRSMQCKFSGGEGISEMVNDMRVNLNDLVISKGDMIPSMKIQVKHLEEKLTFLSKFVYFSLRCTKGEELEHLWNHIQDCANGAACLSFLYWVGETEDKMTPLHSRLIQKIKPCSPEAVLMYLVPLKAPKLSGYDIYLMADALESFLDILLENMVTPTKVHIEILLEGLMFLLSFVIDPPEEQSDDEKSMLKECKFLAHEAVSLICLLSHAKSEEDMARDGNILVQDFLQKVDKAKAKVGDLYVQIPISSEYTFWRTNGLGFIDSLLENLKEKLKYKMDVITFKKYQIVLVQEELMPLGSFLKNIQNLQNKQEEFEDLQLRIVNVAYQMEYAIESYLCLDAVIWYDLARLSKIIQEARFINTEVKEIEDKQMYNTGKIGAKVNSSEVLTAQANNSRMDEVIVGFSDEADVIRDRLTGGTSELDIVAIVGMPGQGKTTLAKKILKDPFIQYHFIKRAWCHVSQMGRSRELLFTILNDLIGSSDQFRGMGEEELAEMVYRSLRGRRYLIMMDDIWDIKVWNELRVSFPDDKNGSRILFTSRIHSLASQAKPGCSPHFLRPFSNEESQELLQKKLFHDDGWPPHVSELGNQIARNCNGLPLAVVLTAGLLSKNISSPNWWKEIAECLGSRISSEGCKDILELSYKHLPDFLKPCFLYFGALREVRVIKVRKLTLLWISEGFIKKSSTKSRDDVAKEYLMDLVGRSLVIVVNRSSVGQIKECCIHDLLHQFCREKAEEEGFLHLPNVSDLYYKKMTYKHYRLSIHTEWWTFVNSEPGGSHVRSLLFNGEEYLISGTLLGGSTFIESDHSCPYNLSFLLSNDAENLISPEFFLSFKLLRVLDMEDVIFGRHFPRPVTALVHLRYLVVSGFMSTVPSSIANLWNLETFRMEKCSFRITLPDAIWKMKSLRHVHIDPDALISVGDDEQGKPSKLHNLETFSLLCFDSKEIAEKQLRRLPDVQKLGIRLFSYVPFSCLPSKIESLRLDAFEAVDHPWVFNFPLTLKKLTFSRVKIPQTEISAIGKLPNLEVLKLLEVEFEGKRWDVDDEGFLNLKFLKLRSMLKEWNASPDSFPCVQQLILNDCFLLEEIPACFGVMPTLEMIAIHCCGQKLIHSAHQILKEQQDLGNKDLKLHISITIM